MSALSIQPTFPIFTDIDGQPLEDGFVWIGQANLDPQVNPINVFWNAALTIPAGQPIRTRGGYPVNSGTPARLYVNSNYSIRVMNRNGSTVYSAPTATERYGEVVSVVNAVNVLYDPAGVGAVQTSVQNKLREQVSVFDFMTETQKQQSLGGFFPELTTEIQNALNAGARQVVFPAGSTYISSGNEIPSDRHLIFEQGSIVRLKNFSSRPLFQNTNWQSSTWGGNPWGLDKNITIEGLYMDGNYATQNRIGTGIYFGEYTSGMRFGGVTNLVIKDCTIYQAKTFAIWVYSILNLTAHNITYDQFMGAPPLNQDGLHVNGPARNLDIRNHRGSTNDDMIALNADDGFLGNEMTTGPITDAVIDGVYPVDSLHVVRLLSATSRMDRIIVMNIVGTSRDVVVNQSPFGLGPGNVGALTIENIDVRCGPFFNAPGSIYFSVIGVEGIVDTISIRNIRWNRPIDNRPVVLFGPSTNVGNVLIDNISAFQTGSSVAPQRLVRWEGTFCGNMSITNISWFRDVLLAQEGAVIQIAPVNAAHGINNLSCSNWSVIRCSDLIHQTRGYLNALFARDILSSQQLNGSRVVLLASSDPSTTQLDIRDCYTDAVLALVVNSSQLGPRSHIDPMGLSYFLAVAGVNQAIPAAAFTKVNFAIRQYDGANEYDVVSSSFQCQKAQGLYEFSWSVRFNSPTPATGIGFAIYLNNVLHRYVGQSTTLETAGDNVFSGAVRIYLLVNDVVDLRIFAGNAVNILSGNDSTSFACNKIS